MEMLTKCFPIKQGFADGLGNVLSGMSIAWWPDVVGEPIKLHVTINNAYVLKRDDAKKKTPARNSEFKKWNPKSLHKFECADISAFFYKAHISYTYNRFFILIHQIYIL
ncbi:hypothetical protein LOAG_01988 [Loa loa]|uniref:Uncharacterized protein n=1 Tax=Loa loa TaxID=7209 RepID=A0A1S0U7Q3_LOALO|nr:hypothetical protein LOAG_01988 [Loa loa]EFO26502.1 hypothetical protein LOAG_01988 [Loa loa]